MTVEELSNQFDVQLQDYINAKSFGAPSTFTFNEYEKSVFLTRAQQDIVLGLYRGDNEYTISFESTEEARRALSSLIITTSLALDSTLQSTDNTINDTSNIKDGLYHHIYKLPDDVLFILYEEAITNHYCSAKGRYIIPVIPVRLDKLHKILNSPFTRPNNRRCYRLDLADNSVEIISKYELLKDKASYVIRYLAKPLPIILEDLRPYNLTIEGQYLATESSLPEYLQTKVINLAVAQAVASRLGSITSYANVNNQK